MTTENLILNTAEWFAATGQIPAGAPPSARQTAFYTGMQVEELAEKLECVLGLHHHMVKELHALGTSLKAGNWDDRVARALTSGLAGPMLDADMDLVWVSLGAAAAQGADAAGAYGAVTHANWDKKDPTTGEFKRAPDTGKVLKRAGWVPPDLHPHLHPTLRNR